MYSVYQIEVDGKKYIGCTGELIARRMSRHRYNADKYKRPLCEAMKKAGVFNAVVTVVARFSDKRRAFALERRLIRDTQPALNVLLK